MIPGTLGDAVRCPDTVTFNPILFSTVNKYSKSDTPLILETGILGSLGNYYFAVSINSVDSVFSKRNDNYARQWIRRMTEFRVTAEGVALK